MTITRRPNRLHHTAYVTKDLEATRAFYEDVIGLPLIATWTEADELFGKLRTYCHVFFELNDGSCLAFFQFADPADQAEFGPDIPSSPFIHIALHVDKDTQEALEARIKAAGITEPATYVLEHGYCRSVYVTDPNGMILEFTYDAPEALDPALDAQRRANAHAELKRWLAGDHTNNNNFRSAA
ncbi:glyoxalase [Sandarakinorhabdus cyanobacteriorum]|uniref:Glyoxalase n=1 Tax=Sandarakinorhabdus cyanobacteriorum TaxID=1981098 RepID=A0A255Y5D9_9SPHN|nr:VOC family protein [Sandarakinorhabdus cyanobacteriorum]OYQ24383.1 glyoxalase [Sandarakinorhabdus cyanobacteriorum]